jgi:hypothetical protein
MNGFVSLATSIAVSLIVSTAVLLLLVHPLKRVLAMLGKSGEATPFWVSFTIVMLYAVPLFVTLIWAPQSAEAFRTVRVALVTSLFGLIGGLVVMGYKIANARQA